MVIEAFIIGKLSEILDVPVYAERPAEPPAEYVLVQKTSGGRSNWICRGTFAVQSYAATKIDAANLNEAVKKAMDGLIVYDRISGLELESDYPFPDTATKSYRYQAVYTMTFYEE